MVKLVDTQVLGTCALRRGGSSPSRRTIPKLVDEIVESLLASRTRETWWIYMIGQHGHLKESVTIGNTIHN